MWKEILAQVGRKIIIKITIAIAFQPRVNKSLIFKLAASKINTAEIAIES